MKIYSREIGPKFEHLVIDLETLGTSVDSAILQIGAVGFSLFHEETCHFNEVISLQSNLLSDRTVNESTLKWHINQNNKNFLELLNCENALTLYAALSNLEYFMIDKFNCDEVFVWGNGPDFDNAILADAFSEFSLNLPWDFRNNRCYRTLKHLCPSSGERKMNKEHDALKDAIETSQHIKELLISIFLN